MLNLHSSRSDAWPPLQAIVSDDMDAVDASEMSALIVDDDESIRAGLAAYLEEFGLKDISTVSNGQEALAVLASSVPDFLLLDLMMPFVDGFQVLQTIRRQDADARPRRTVVLSAHVDYATGKHLLELGADACLQKPFSCEELISALAL